MTSPITGPTEQEVAAKASTAFSLRTEFIKKFALGSGGTVGMAVVYGAFELLHNDSRDAFPLLEHWGPWAIVSTIAIYLVSDLVKHGLNIGLRGVMAIESLAVAQARCADKDDRQIQEIQTLSSFSAQESERTASKMGELVDLVTTLNFAVSSLKTAVDGANNDRQLLLSIATKLDAALGGKG